MRQAAPAAEPANGSYLRGAAFGLAAVSIWSGWMPVTRLGVTGALDSWDLAALRFAVGGLLLFPVVLRRGLALDRLGWGGLAVLVAGAGAPYALVAAAGLRFAPAAHGGALIPGVMPLFVALIAAAVLGERPTPPRLAGLGLIAAGVLAVAGAGLLTDGDLGLGHGLFLTASFMWACFTVAMRRARLDALHAAALVSVGSFLIYIPAYLAFRGTGIVEVPVRDLAVQATYQGLLTTVISLILYGRAVAILGAAGGAAFGALVPALAALLAIPVLGEVPSVADWVGIASISLGVYLASGGRVPAAILGSTQPARK